jgi:hypothetical protein
MGAEQKSKTSGRVAHSEEKIIIYNMLQFSHDERKNKGLLIRTESAVARAAAWNMFRILTVKQKTPALRELLFVKYEVQFQVGNETFGKIEKGVEFRFKKFKNGDLVTERQDKVARGATYL